MFSSTSLPSFALCQVAWACCSTWSMPASFFHLHRGEPHILPHSWEAIVHFQEPSGMVRLRSCHENQSPKRSLLDSSRSRTTCLRAVRLSSRYPPRSSGTRRSVHHWETSGVCSSWSSPCVRISLSLPVLRTLGTRMVLWNLRVVSSWQSQWLSSVLAGQEGCSCQDWATFRSWKAALLCTTTNHWLAFLPPWGCACSCRGRIWDHVCLLHVIFGRSFRKVCTGCSTCA